MNPQRSATCVTVTPSATHYGELTDNQGGTYTYTVRVDNNAVDAASNTRLTLSVPAGATFLSASPAGANCAPTSATTQAGAASLKGEVQTGSRLSRIGNDRTVRSVGNQTFRDEVDVRSLGRGDPPAVAEYRHAVGNLEHVLEEVRDEDEAGALGLEPAQHREQALDLRR